MSKPTRPALRYHGGKWKLAPWIIEHIPTHKVYVEPFGGGASVLLRKERSYSEIYNDLDGEVVNFFRVVRDHGQALRKAIELTPFAREELKLAYEAAQEPIEQARRTLVRSIMGFSSASASGQTSGFRSCSSRTGTTPAHDWSSYSQHIDNLIERLRGVVIENKDAQALVKAHDSKDAVHYVDPPYTHESRKYRKAAPAYRHEMTDDEHRALATTLNKLKGAVVLSGYRSELYDSLYQDWLRIDAPTYADGAKPRIESIWLNQACHKRLLQDSAQESLFDECCF